MTCLGNAHSIILHLLITLCSCAVMSSAYGQTDPSVVSEMATAAYPDDMYIDLVVPSHRLYLGEVIRIEYDVYVAKSRGIVHYDNQEPDFESWFIYEDSVPEPSIEKIQDKTYTKEPYAAFFVAPLKAGHLLLPTLAVTIPYKQPSTWITHAAHTVEVLPPPQPYPEDFDFHNVGRIQLSANIPEKRIVEVGKTFSYTYKITSNTPTEDIKLTFASTEIPKTSMRIYPLKQRHHTESSKDGQFYSETEYVAMVAPRLAGTFSLPSARIVFFNPETQHYDTVSVPGFDIIATPSRFSAEPPTMISSLEIDTAQPREILIQSPTALPLIPRWFDLMVILFTGVGILIFILIKRRRAKHLQADKTQYIDDLFTNFKEEQTSAKQLDIFHELLAYYLHTDFERTVHLDIDMLRDSGLSIQDALQLANLHDLMVQANYSGQHTASSKDIDECIRILKLIANKD